MSQGFANTSQVTPASIQQGKFTTGVDSGAANAYVAAYIPNIATLTGGMELTVTIANLNSGASTLDVGTGAIAILNLQNTALIGGELPAGNDARFIYNAGLTSWILQNSSLASGGGGITINDSTSTPQAITNNNGYVANNAGLQTFTLPATAAVGDQFMIYGSNSAGWIITQGASQILHVGAASSTTGASGSFASSNRYDCATFTCIVADTEWVGSAIQGNLTPA